MSKKLQDMLAVAARAEIESKEVYEALADQMENFILKDKFKFLAAEEDKHRIILENVFKETFPNDVMELPEDSGVPKPDVNIREGNLLSDILEQAMKAEQSAAEFYKEMAPFFEDQNMRALITYLANIEQGHYYFLNIEREMALQNEDYWQAHDMMHIGP
jgi:rubrerythrin